MNRLQILTNAVRTAIKNKCRREEISVPHWAAAYNVTQKQVRETWEAELTKQFNANPIGEGK